MVTMVARNISHHRSDHLEQSGQQLQRVMAIWYYYNKTGGKTGPFTVAALKELVRQGVVTRETVIENTNGRTIIAGEVNGLTFPEAPPVQPKPAAKPVKPAPVPVPPVHPATPVLPRVPVRAKQSKNRPKPVIIAGIAGAALLLLLFAAGVWWMRGPSTATVGPVAPVGQEQKPVEPVPVIEKSGFADIFAALRQGTVQDVRYFIEKEGVDVNVQEPGRTGNGSILNMAVFYTRHDSDAVSDIVKYLIEKGADVNAVNQGNNDMTPLHTAIYSDKNVETVKFLVANGADVTAKNKDGHTPLRLAIIYNRNIAIIKFLISKEEDINAKDGYGFTLLHSVSGHNNSIELAKFLIESGADINAKNRQDQTPLQVVIIRGKPGYSEVVKFLVSSGAKIDDDAINQAKQRKEMLNETEGAEVVEYLSGIK